MFNLPETEKIYFPEIKEYFNEVMSCYVNKNYRAANVMLYSIVICDLMLKLKELRDLYDDKKADEILDYVEKERQAGRTNSSWEKALLDKIFKETKLLDLESKSHIDRLYDDRNLSAHPALDQDYLLITPSQETTIANIKNILKDVLIKPPIFINNMVDRITEELARNYDVLMLKDDSSFDRYINNTYLNRMSDSMKEKVFRTFWKFVFVSKDKDCSENRLINYRFLKCLYLKNSVLLQKYFKDHVQLFKIGNSFWSQMCLFIFLGENDSFYSCFTEELKDFVKYNAELNINFKILSWFLYENIDQHIEVLKDLKEINYEKNIYKISFDKLKEYYLKIGEKEKLIEAYMFLYEHSVSYDMADYVFSELLDELICEFNGENIKDLITISTYNNQIYDRRNARKANKKIYDRAKEIFGDNFDISKYENFYI